MEMGKKVYKEMMGVEVRAGEIMGCKCGGSNNTKVREVTETWLLKKVKGKRTCS